MQLAPEPYHTDLVAIVPELVLQHGAPYHIVVALSAVLQHPIVRGDAFESAPVFILAQIERDEAQAHAVDD